MKQRKYDKDFFNAWRDTKTPKYYWLQIDYMTDTYEPYHVVAENNDRRDGHICWPVGDELTTELPIDNLDFRQGASVNLTEWDKQLSLAAEVGIEATGLVTEPSGSYDEYQRSARLQGSSCVDVDVIEANGGQFVGIEGTSLFSPMYDKGRALSLFGQILEKRFFLDGAHQLLVEKKFMEKLGGQLFLVIYNEDGGKLVEEGNCLIVAVDDDFVEALKSKDTCHCLNCAEYARFAEAYARISGLHL